MANSVLFPIAMTSNITPSPYVVSASSQTTNYEAFKAFNGVISAYQQGWLSASKTGWIRVDLGQQKKINKIALCAFADDKNGGATLGRMPRTWTFEGSNNGAFNGEQTILINISNDTSYIQLEKRQFTVLSPQKFQYYRLNIVDNYNGENLSGMPEIELYEAAYYHLTLVNNNGTFYGYSNNVWNLVSTGFPTENDFINGGIVDLSSIPESAWAELQGDVELCYYTDDPDKTETQFNIETDPFTLAEEWEDKEIKIIEYTDNPNQAESVITLETEPFTMYDELGDSVDVLYYTDDPNKNSANLELTANYTPLDEIDGDFEVVTWTDDEEAESMNVNMNALPFEQMVLQLEDFNVPGAINSIITSPSSSINQGTLRFIFSFDSGQTWQVCRFNKWKAIEITPSIISKYGMTLEEVNKLTKDNFDDKPNNIRIGYYLDESIHSGQSIELDNLKLSALSPTEDAKLSDMAMYVLNTTATIQLELQGNKLIGSLSDTDKGKVQYRIILNGSPYFPINGEYTSLALSPVEIEFNISDRDIIFNQPNTVRVEFQDAWGQSDFWEAKFVGTYSGLMFIDSTGEYLSDTFGGILKYLDFGTIVAGQTTLDQKVIIKNQMGYSINNLTLEVLTDQLPEGVNVELSKESSPFIGSSKLSFTDVIKHNESVEVYTRIVTSINAKPWPGGRFGITAKADKVK